MSDRPDYIGKPIGSFLGSVLGGFVEGQEEQGLKNLYNTSINKLTEFFNPPATYTDQTGQIPRSQVTQNMVNDVPTQQTFQPDVKGAMQSLYETLPQFMEYGDKGKPYANLLSSFFESNMPKQPDYGVTEVNGQLFKYNKQNPSQIEPITQPKQEKPPKKTVEDYGKMSYEDILKLTPDELKDAYYFANEDTQKKLYDSNKYIRDMVDAEFKQGIYSPKTGRTGFRRGSFKETTGEGKDISKFLSLGNMYERQWAGEKFTADSEEDKKYKVLKNQLGKEYDMNDVQLQNVIERLNNTRTDKEKVDILNSLKDENYHEPTQVSQEQVDYDRQRIQEWVDYLDEIAKNEGYGEQWNIQKANFWKEVDEYYSRGSITKKEYNDFRKSYY